jgi:hypothetical protein
MAPRTYTVVVEGELRAKYASAFPGMELLPCGGVTNIVGTVEDQAHLRGILDAVAAYNLTLVSITPVPPGGPADYELGRHSSRPDADG